MPRLNDNQPQALLPQRMGLRREEAAELTGVSLPVIDAQIVAKKLKVRFIGRRIVILPAELEAWLASLPTEPQWSAPEPQLGAKRPGRPRKDTALAATA